MSEVENNQETNGTSNGDVPEIELIIKEEFMLNEFEENTNESEINRIASSENLNDVDEKENIIQSTLQHKQQQHHQHIRDCKTVNTENLLSPRKDVFANHQNEPAEADNVLMLTHYDNQHFHFEYVTQTQDENLLQTTLIRDHTATAQLSDSSNNGNQRSRVPFFQNHISEKIVVKDENSRASSKTSNIDFAAMVAEACEGIFDEIENDLRSYNMDSDNNSCDEIEAGADCDRCSVVEKRKKRAHNSEAVQLATKAVVEGGMTLGEAAKCYNVVRSTVSSRVAKHPKRKRRKSNKQLEELIYSKLMAGIQISEISRSLHVPKSTVHLHKTRLKDRGLLPAVWINNGSQDVVDTGVQKRLMQAYRGHIVNGMSVRFAAEFFSLPLTTLWRYIKRRKTSTITAIKNDSSTCAATESSISQEETTESTARTPYENIEKDGNSEMQKIQLPCTSSLSSSSSSTCPTTFMKVNPNEDALFEQSLINQLLE